MHQGLGLTAAGVQLLSDVRALMLGLDQAIDTARAWTTRCAARSGWRASSLPGVKQTARAAALAEVVRGVFRDATEPSGR